MQNDDYKLEIKDQRDFDNVFHRDDLFNTEHLRLYFIALFCFISLTIFFLIKVEKFKNYDPSKVKLTAYQERILKIIVENTYKYKSEPANKPISGKFIRNNVIKKKKKDRNKEREQLRRELEAKLDQLIVIQSDVEILDDDYLIYYKESLKSDFNLADESELDDILNNLYQSYNEEKSRELYVSEETRRKFEIRTRAMSRLIEIDTRRITDIGFGAIKNDKFLIQGHRTEIELKQIDKIVAGQEYIINSCIKKFQFIDEKLKGYFTLQFRIDSLGKIVKESIKIVDSNVKNTEFLSCIIRNAGFIRGFPKASVENASDYIFRKKWVF